MRIIRWTRALLGATLRVVHGAYTAAGLLLSAALLLALLGLVALSALTDEVLEGETARFDDAVLLWLNARATPWLDTLAIEITVLGDGAVTFTIALVAASLLWLLRRAAYALLLAAAVSGGAAITAVLKAMVDRPRPHLSTWRAHVPEPVAAYPSGHATLAMVTFAALAFIFHRIAARTAVSLAATTVALVIVLLVGLSRVYLGVHYPSDVIAGYIVGFAWVVACALVAESLGRKRRARSGDGDSREAGP